MPWVLRDSVHLKCLVPSEEPKHSEYLRMLTLKLQELVFHNLGLGSIKHQHHQAICVYFYLWDSSCFDRDALSSSRRLHLISFDCRIDTLKHVRAQATRTEALLDGGFRFLPGLLALL